MNSQVNLYVEVRSRNDLKPFKSAAVRKQLARDDDRISFVVMAFLAAMIVVLAWMNEKFAVTSSGRTVWLQVETSSCLQGLPT